MAQHHSAIYALVIVFHTIHGSGMSFLLSHADTIYLTANRNSSFSLKSIWQHYKLPADQLDSNLKLLSENKPFTYLKITPDSGEVEFFKLNDPASTGPTDSGKSGNAQVGGKKSELSRAAIKRARMMKRGARFSAMMPNAEAAKALVDLIVPVLPPASVDDALVVTLENSATGETTSVNVLDYIFFCVSPDAKPSSSALKFHNYIRKKNVQIPLFLVKNKYFRKSNLSRQK